NAPVLIGGSGSDRAAMARAAPFGKGSAFLVTASSRATLGCRIAVCTHDSIDIAATLSDMRLTEKVRLGREMRHSLGDRFLVVVRPSHPYLVAPPDVLIGGEGLLTAVFSPSANERRAPLLIRPRLVGARLALPENTRCILLSPRGFLGDTADQSSGQQSLRYDFDAVVAEESYRQLAEIAASNDVRMTRPSELEKVRLENAARSAIALSLSEIARSRDTESSKIFGGSIKSHLSAIAAPGLPLRKATRPT